MEVFGFILAIILVTGLVLSCISSVRDMISELRYRPTDAWDIVDIVVRTLFYIGAVIVCVIPLIMICINVI